MLTVVIAKNTGPYTLHYLEGQVVPVSHRGPHINSLWITPDEESCLNEMKQSITIEEVLHLSPVEASQLIHKILLEREDYYLNVIP